MNTLFGLTLNKVRSLWLHTKRAVRAALGMGTAVGVNITNDSRTKYFKWGKHIEVQGMWRWSTSSTTFNTKLWYSDWFAPKQVLRIGRLHWRLNQNLVNDQFCTRKEYYSGMVKLLPYIELYYNRKEAK